MSELLNQQKVEEIIDNIIKGNNDSNEKNKLKRVNRMSKGGFGVISN